MIRELKTRIALVRARIQYLQKYYAENPNRADNLTLHCLDVRLETLEEILNLSRKRKRPKP
jgi:hypothetical protein